MNKLDMIIIGISALATALGLWKGMVRQIVTLAGVACGYFISLKLYEPVANILPKSIEPGVAKAISFVLIFVVFIIVSFILGAIVGNFLKIAGLGWANRLGGGLIGFLKGFVIIAIVVAVLIAFLPSNSAFLDNSITLPYVLSGIRIMGDIMPHDIQEKYQNKIGEVRRELAAKSLEKVGDQIKKMGTSGRGSIK
jgi:membrane protein required for colicin V production